MKNTSHLKWLGLCLIILTISCLIAGCTSGTESNSALKADEPLKVTDLVVIGKNSFSPEMMVITPGTTVTWTNEDDVPHTVTSDQGSDMEFSSKELQNGDNFQVTFNKRGTYNYHCSHHPSMKGTVVVQT